MRLAQSKVYAVGLLAKLQVTQSLRDENAKKPVMVPPHVQPGENANKTLCPSPPFEEVCWRAAVAEWLISLSVVAELRISWGGKTAFPSGSVGGGRRGEGVVSATESVCDEVP
ncbi:hypothetical protein P7C73_g3583, partial [Tremellales sp. Uapishka_1]